VSEPLAVPVALQRGRPVGWWAMLLLVATEGALFGVMIASYFYVRFRSEHWPPPGVPEPKVLVPTALTILLVSTSLPIAVAVWAARRQLAERARLGLLVSLVLGAIYVVGQSFLLVDEWHAGPATADAYDSLFFTLQGAHGAHVVVGVFANLYLLLKIGRGRLTQYRVNGIWAFSLYWHFVNALAVPVLLTTISPSV
jgi:cytochrome c oxidase subunit III